jgi:nucleoside-diphosphate-sugar epimerase
VLASLFQAHRVDVVIHLAGLLATACRSDPAEAVRVTIGGSANLLDAAARHGVRRFVCSSSFSVYLPGDIYGATKRFVELYGETLARRSGTQFGAAHRHGRRFRRAPYRLSLAVGDF